MGLSTRWGLSTLVTTLPATLLGNPLGNPLVGSPTHPATTTTTTSCAQPAPPAGFLPPGSRRAARCAGTRGRRAVARAAPAAAGRWPRQPPPPGCSPPGGWGRHCSRAGVVWESKRGPLHSPTTHHGHSNFPLSRLGSSTSINNTAAVAWSSHLVPPRPIADVHPPLLVGCVVKAWVVRGQVGPKPKDLPIVDLRQRAGDAW